MKMSVYCPLCGAKKNSVELKSNERHLHPTGETVCECGARLIMENRMMTDQDNVIEITFR